MKKIILIFILSLNIIKPSLAVGTLDSTSVMNGFAAINKNLKLIDSALIKLNTPPSNDAKQPCKICNEPGRTMPWCSSFLNYFLIVLPIILLILLLFIVLKKDGFNFRQALYSDDPEDIQKMENGQLIKITLLDDKGKPVYYPSTSKLIAFLTGVTTLIVIICFISYYAYCMMKCLPVPEFKNLSEMIMALGLGVVPYGVSKISGAAAAKSDK